MSFVTGWPRKRWMGSMGKGEDEARSQMIPFVFIAMWELKRLFTLTTWLVVYKKKSINPLDDVVVDVSRR